ncbi:MAG: sec-independent protein translocase protein TatA [Microbacteriaceae bacterium]|jgi:sec-independent protein translocase protein TatA|nr:sec-independent protein translocase protein TatA [Microbacteriaceae bacterium]
MLGNLTGWHLAIVLAIVLLLFGAAKLPALSKSVAQSVKIFRTEVKPQSDDDSKLDAAAASIDSAEPPARSERS